MKEAEKTNEVETQKFEVGERVKFEDMITKSVSTRFGVSEIVFFADKDGVVVKKCFAQGGMLDFLNKNPDAKSICLKKKLIDGDRTMNVWSI